MTFVERTIALSLAASWDAYYRLCERLRHKDGRQDFLERNFFTLVQWVPNNAWLLVDITNELGPVSTFTHVANPKQFYARLAFGEDDTDKGRAKAAAKAAKVAAVPDRVVTTETYIEAKAIPDVIVKLRTGDIVLAIRRFQPPGGTPWLDCDHMLVVVRDGTFVDVVQSNFSGVNRKPLTRFLDAAPFVAGLKFLRLRDDASRRAQEELAKLTTLTVPSPDDQDAMARTARALRE